MIVRGINAPSYLFIVQGLLELNILKRHSLVHHLRFCCTFAIAVFANLLSLLDYFELILTSNSSSTVPIELLFSHSVVSLPRIYFRIFEFRSAELVVGTMTLSVLVYKLLDLWGLIISRFLADFYAYLSLFSGCWSSGTLGASLYRWWYVRWPHTIVNRRVGSEALPMPSWFHLNWKRKGHRWRTPSLYGTSSWLCHCFVIPLFQAIDHQYFFPGYRCYHHWHGPSLQHCFQHHQSWRSSSGWGLTCLLVGLSSRN